MQAEGAAHRQLRLPNFMQGSTGSLAGGAFKFVLIDRSISSTSPSNAAQQPRSASAAPPPLLAWPAAPSKMEAAFAVSSCTAVGAPHRPQQQRPCRRRQQRRQCLTAACSAQPPRVVLYDAYDRLVPYEQVTSRVLSPSCCLHVCRAHGPLIAHFSLFGRFALCRPARHQRHSVAGFPLTCRPGSCRRTL